MTSVNKIPKVPGGSFFISATLLSTAKVHTVPHPI